MIKLKKVLILVITTLLLTGCWNYRELNDLGIVSAISIEKKEEMIHVTVQFMNIQKSGGSSGATISNPSVPITTVTTKGKTVHEALRGVVKITPKKAYIGHMDLLIIEQKTAEDGILDIIDFFFRDSESRKQFKVLISQKNEEDDDILSIVTLLEGFPSKSMLSSLMATSRYSGQTVLMNFDELLSLMYAEGVEPVAPLISVNGNEQKGSNIDNLESSKPNANIKISGSAVFKKKKVIGTLDEMETLGLNIITNKLSGSVITFNCEEEKYATAEVSGSKTNFKVDFSNKIPKVKLNTEIEAFLSEINCKKNITESEVVEDIEKKAAERIKDIMITTIEKAQKELNSDILGIGNNIRKENYKKWKELKEDWYDIFPNIEFEVKTTLRFTKKGATVSPAEDHDIGVQ